MVTRSGAPAGARQPSRPRSGLEAPKHLIAPRLTFADWTLADRVPWGRTRRPPDSLRLSELDKGLAGAETPTQQRAVLNTVANSSSRHLAVTGIEMPSFVRP